jgi:hypothetical protein
MPLDIGASRAPLPPEFEELAGQEDEIIGETLMVVVPPPDKPYSKKVLTGLAMAIAEVAGMMGLDLGAGEYDGPTEAMDPEMVRFLAMIGAAADEYGKPLPVALEDIKGDRELTAITAAIKGLLSDPEFQAFLEQEIPDAEPDTELPDMGGEDEDVEVEEFDFAARMRR